MRIDRGLFFRHKVVIPALATSYVLTLGILLSATIFCAYYHIPVEKFTRDPAVIFDGNPFTGFVSNIGILLWCSTSATCLFTSLFVKRHLSTYVFYFILCSGLLTSLLLYDDLFMFHDYVYHEFFHIRERYAYLAYLVLMLAYVLVFANIIIHTEYIYFFIACGLFALSIGCDGFLPQNGMEFLVEDGFKLFGIVTWSLYFVRTCYVLIQNVINGSKSHLVERLGHEVPKTV